MKRPRCRYRAALVAVIVAALSARGAGQTHIAGAALRVSTSGDYKPFSFRDVHGMLTGFDISVARRLAADLGRSIELVPFRWADLPSQLRSGAFDITMSGVTVRADRAVLGLFTRPYAVTGAVAVVRVQDRERYRDVSDLDREGVRIAVNAGGHLEQVARQHFVHARLITVTDNSTLPDLLLGGTADAVISEELEAQTWSHKRFAIYPPFTRDRKAYVLPRGAADLLRRVNDWLAAREADGWLNAERRRWFGERAVQTPQHAAVEALVAAMDLRLQLMPLVAAVKRREQLPVEDPAQEARVLEHVREVAAAAELNAEDVAQLFRVQMELAKAVEHGASTASVAPDVLLADVRAAVAAASDQIITELARCQPLLLEPHARAELDGTVRDGVGAPGLSAALITDLLNALHGVRRLPKS